jgi:DNA-binding CsgD family transcriptional regulator
METARESQLSRALAGPEASAAARSHAVCDTAGVLLHLDDRCQALLRLEWPQWPGGSLPEALQDAALQAEGQPAFVGRRIVVRLVSQGNTLLLAVRLRAAQDRLSARQRGIAELYASGCTGSEIAERLGLATSTVNNHLGDIFKKLQVSSKVQLARALQGKDT